MADLEQLERDVIQTAIAIHCRRNDGDAKFLFHEAVSALIEARYQSVKAKRVHQHYCGLADDHDGKCVAVVTRMLGV